MRSWRPGLASPCGGAKTGAGPSRTQSDPAGTRLLLCSRPRPRNSAATARPHPQQLPAAGQRPADAPKALLRPVARAAESQGDPGLPRVGGPAHAPPTPRPAHAPPPRAVLGAGRPHCPHSEVSGENWGGPCCLQLRFPPGEQRGHGSEHTAQRH